MIQRIKPIRLTPKATPQCCVPTKDFYPYKWCSSYVERRREKAKVKGFLDDHCQQQSSFLIDGKHYCTKHAGQKALEILMQAD